MLTLPILMSSDAFMLLHAAADLSHDNQDELFCHLAITLLQQSHLCPLPLVVQPVHWQFDQALQLYPLPHAVILADSSAPSSYRHSGCHVFNPVGDKRRHAMRLSPSRPSMGMAAWVLML